MLDNEDKAPTFSPLKKLKEVAQIEILLSLHILAFHKNSLYLPF